MAGRRNILPAMHEKGLEVYFRDINRYDLITREDEVSLALRIKAGEDEALQCLVRANLRFVVSVAKRYINQGLMLSDLINEGNLGLLKAAHRFDEKRGYRFISYAVWWIRAYILKYILNNWRMVKIGTTQHQRKLFFNLRKEMERLRQETALTQVEKCSAEKAIEW